MIKNRWFFELLKKKGIRLFCGVPDSSLKNICAYITDNTTENEHVITANEGGAIGLATGHYLATDNPALVYMQNSGQGNAVNPLVSLADPKVYSIPMLLMIGWRGEPGKTDEPQHLKQGQITLSLLDTLGILYFIMPENENDIKQVLDRAFDYMHTKKSPVALVARTNSFELYKQVKPLSPYSLSRERVIASILDYIGDNDVVISTTGKASREVYECRKANNQGHEKDFLTVGSMGHSSQIALGIAMELPHKQVFCLDGDGALIMHMGSLAIIGSKNVPNFKHIALNNSAHESVGGQPTVADKISLMKIAQECGYKYIDLVKDEGQLESSIQKLKESQGPAFLEICVNLNSRSDLGRPKTTPQDNKESFMEFLRK